MIQGDADGVQKYTAAVARLARAYRGDARLFGRPEWEAAEREVEKAFQAKDSRRFTTALFHFERVGIGLIAGRQVA